MATDSPEMEPEEWDLLVTLVATLDPKPYQQPVKDLIEKTRRICEAGSWTIQFDPTRQTCPTCDGEGWTKTST